MDAQEHSAEPRIHDCSSLGCLGHRPYPEPRASEPALSAHLPHQSRRRATSNSFVPAGSASHLTIAPSDVAREPRGPAGEDFAPGGRGGTARDVGT